MIFFTSLLIVVILYFLQADGLIYVTIIAVAAELINLFLTHTLTKSVEKKFKNQHKQAVEKYIRQLKLSKKKISELEKIRDDAGKKLYKANNRVKELETHIKQTTGKLPGQMPEKEQAPPAEKKAPEAEHATPNQAPDQVADRLPQGSGRKSPPI